MELKRYGLKRSFYNVSHFPGKTEETHKHVRQDIRSPGLDLKPGLPERKAGVPTND